MAAYIFAPPDVFALRGHDSRRETALNNFGESPSRRPTVVQKYPFFVFYTAIHSLECPKASPDRSSKNNIYKNDRT